MTPLAVAGSSCCSLLPALEWNSVHRASRQLDVNNLATGAMPDILAPSATTIECVPAILDLDHLPDKGRMTGQLPSPARTFCSSVLKPASAPPFSIPCWRQSSDRQPWISARCAFPHGSSTQKHLKVERPGRKSSFRRPTFDV